MQLEFICLFQWIVSGFIINANKSINLLNKHGEPKVQEESLLE